MAPLDPVVRALQDEDESRGDGGRVLTRFVVVSEWAHSDGSRSLELEHGQADGTPLEAWERDMLLRAQEYMPGD